MPTWASNWLADVERAATSLHPVIRELPPLRAGWLDDLAGGPVWLIPENLQRAGSFKIRGAYTRISRLDPELRRRGVVAASAGNHAQGVAVAAGLLGVEATVFMPHGATIPKVIATRGYGATVEFAGHSVDAALIAARDFAERTGAVLIHPFDHPDVVVGQGTLALEILARVPSVRTVLVCTGGGGLLAGIGTTMAAVDPSISVIGVQAAGAAAYPASLRARAPIRLPAMSTMADGIAVGQPGAVPFELVQQHVRDVVTVTEEQLSRAVLMLLERAKLLVEPAGAAGAAALIGGVVRGGQASNRHLSTAGHGPEPPREIDAPVAVVLSGGNVDPLLLSRIIRHGLAAAGRFLTVTVRAPDQPGSLAGVLGAVGSVGGNVIEIEHNRLSANLAVDEVEIVIQLELRGHDHRLDVLRALSSCEDVAIVDVVPHD